ncbi:MAG: HAD-IC family P-type ATPase [Bacilli bacterium]|nr:HAD-IC family P-type ATPase [Bacilli bacterium]
MANSEKEVKKVTTKKSAETKEKPIKKVSKKTEKTTKKLEPEVKQISFFDEEENSNTEHIEIKSNNDKNVKVKVIDSETSNLLDKLKKKEVANKPKKVSSAEKDLKEIDSELVVEDGVERFIVDVTQGLSAEQVETRKTQNLTNDNGDEKGKSYLEIVLSNIFTVFNILYFIITIILIWAKKTDQLIFLFVLIPNIIIGLIQEINSKRTVDKLRLMSAPVATVIRDGEKLELSTNEVVLDEIIMYTAGKQICADSVVIDGNIEVNESLLTGEADAIPKVKGSKLLAGSFVSSGTCVARVEKVGKDCYINKMSAEAKKYSAPRSELLKTLKGVIKVISFILLPIAVLYLLSHVQGSYSNIWDTITDKDEIAKISYIILAMIPAGLFLLTSVALAFGVIRLGKNNTLVQQLYCIEMLARVDVLCLDKTGTITDGTMRVCDCVEVNNHTDYTIREIIGSMMFSFKETNPTSEALIKYFDTNNVLQASEVIPFSSKRKYSAVTFIEEGTFIIGAPDFVIKDHFAKIASKVTRFSNQGCRVLVLGHLDNKIKNEELPKNVKPIALIVIQDHIRDDASDTISFFKQNGVDIKVISGDNPETVSKIADRVGVEGAHRFINLNGMTDDEIKECVFDYSVFGRVTPSQKKLIVQTLKAHGKTVAMTGDGVNDIPALKEADCSIAMASGSEATRYVSHLVLMDSNFSSMPKVVNEGRRVINNIQKTSALYLTKNVFAFLIALMYIIIGFISRSDPDNVLFINNGFPFNPKSLFMIEMVILGFATLCLSLQPNREIVKGKFLSNVFKQILPGAITILVYQLIIFFAQKFGMYYSEDGLWFVQLTKGENVFVTMSTLITTFVMLFVLYNACKPFNWFRKIVFSIVLVAIAALLFVPGLKGLVALDFSNFGNSEWLLMVILILAIYPIMQGITKLLSWMNISSKN